LPHPRALRRQYVLVEKGVDSTRAQNLSLSEQSHSTSSSLTAATRNCFDTDHVLNSRRRVQIL